MNKNKINLRFSVITLIILSAAMSRLLPHPPNFAPIGGMALFGAAYFSKKYWAFK
jgi:prepilin signal peptidase PulO-like enzyme (type II secretory pathway)